MKTHTISESETQNLALLARLGLTEQEHVAFKKDIESILGFIDTIQDISASNTPRNQVGFVPVGSVRFDEVCTIQESSKAIDIVGQAPNHTDNFIKVKKILNQ